LISNEIHKAVSVTSWINDRIINKLQLSTDIDRS